MRTGADSERHRTRLEITIRPMVRFSPLMEGDSVCGSKLQGIEKLFFQIQPHFFWFSKRNGVVSI